MLRAKVVRVETLSPYVKVFVRNVSDAKALEKTFIEAQAHEVCLGEVYIAKVSPQEHEFARVVVDRIEHMMKNEEAAEADKKKPTGNDVTEGEKRVAFVRDLDSAKSMQVELDQDRKLRKMESLESEYLLAGVQIATDHDTREAQEALRDILENKVFEIIVVPEDSTGKFVELKLKKRCVNTEIVNNIRAMSSVNVERQVELLAVKEKAEKKKLAVGQKEVKLATGELKQVRITQYDPLTGIFYVHYVDEGLRYRQFQTELKEYKGKERPQLLPLKWGCLCLVRLVGKDLCRAKVVRRMTNTKMEMRLVDTGELADVNNWQMFRMPGEFLGVPPFAKPFKFDDIEKNLSAYLAPEHDGFFFAYLTKDRTLKLQVKKIDGPVPTCLLFEKQVSILKEMISWQPLKLKYAKQKPLDDNDSIAIVTAIKSPAEFFVFIQSEETTQLKKEIQDEFRQIVDPPKLGELAGGNACIVEVGGKFLRGCVTAKAARIYRVVAVDTGFIDDYSADNIKVATKKLAEYPPFAFCCKLNDYKKCSHEKQITEKFIQLTANCFKMNVVKLGDVPQVELFELVSGRNVLDLLREVDDKNCSKKGSPSARQSKPKKANLNVSTDDINDTALWEQSRGDMTFTQPSISAHFENHPPLSSSMMSIGSDNSAMSISGSDKTDAMSVTDSDKQPGTSAMSISDRSA